MSRWFSGAVAAAVVAVLLVPMGSSPAAAVDAPYIFRYRPGVITDPAAPAAARNLPVWVDADSFTSARWVLSDAGGEVLDAPASLTEDAVVGWRGAFDPTAANGGDALPDGTYGLQIETTGESGTSLSNTISIVLAVAPAAEAPAAAPVSDVIPSSTPGVRSTATAVQWMSPGLGFGATVPDGEFTVRNTAGKVIDTRHLQPWCPDGNDGIFCLGEENIDTDGTYSWEWDGRVGGTLQPAGRYTLTARLPDRFGRIVTVSLGNFWIRHLATVKGVRTWSAGTQATYARVGRCSSVVEPGTRGWAGSVGLLSLSRCRSTAGSDDLAGQTFAFAVDARLIERVVAWRLDAYGAPVRSGMRASLQGLTPNGWQRSAVLGAGLDWDNGTTRTSGFGTLRSSSDGRRYLTFHAQAQAVNGNRYDIKLIRTVLTYRAWVR